MVSCRTPAVPPTGLEGSQCASSGAAGLAIAWRQWTRAKIKATESAAPTKVNRAGGPVASLSSLLSPSFFFLLSVSFYFSSFFSIFLYPRSDCSIRRRTITLNRVRPIRYEACPRS